MFYLTKIENARMPVPEPEYLDVGTTEIKAGETLAVKSGKLALEVSAPTHIAAASFAANTPNVPVYRITKDMVFEVPCSTAPSAFVAGAKLALKSDGLEVAAVSESGPVTIVSVNGAKAVGDTVLVRF